MNGETGKNIGLGALLCGAAFVMAGCASPFSPPPADRSSPVAALTDSAARQGRMPGFLDIPAIPADVPPPAAYKAMVVEHQRVGDDVRRATTPDTFVLTGTEPFAARARAAAKAPPAELTAEANTEAFAKAARARASAPPSPR